MKTLTETGLSEDELTAIRKEINKISDIETVTLFGSRAKGSYQRGSDIDLALSGTNLSREDILSLSYNLNQETMLPYHFDVLSLSDADEAIRSHISRVGITIYP